MEEFENDKTLEETATGVVNDDELYERHRIVVDAGQEPMRIDKFLQQR